MNNEIMDKLKEILSKNSTACMYFLNKETKKIDAYLLFYPFSYCDNMKIV